MFVNILVYVNGKKYQYHARRPLWFLYCPTDQIERFGTTSEVVREGLRALDERKIRLEELRKKLAAGEKQAQQGRFVDYSYESLMRKLDQQ